MMPLADTHDRNLDGDSVRPPVLRDVMREHLEETASLQVQWRSLCFDPEATAAQQARVAARLAAHWDALCVGCPDSVEVAAALLDDAFDPWDVAAAARTWLELGEPELDAVCERLTAAAEEARGGWSEALRRAPATVAARLLPLADELAAGTPALGPLVSAWGWHGLLAGDCARKAADSADPGVRFALARALGWSAPAHTEVDALLERLASDQDERVRRAALWSRFLRDPGAGLAALRQVAVEPAADPFGPLVLGLLRRDEAGIAPESEAAEPSLAALWRLSLPGERPELAWLRREVPDGFFAAALSDEVVPGE
jgi:hypothetical protein